MMILTPPPFSDYDLLDSGNGYRLERFGANIIARPDNNCIWKQLEPTQWEQANAFFKKKADGKMAWEKDAFKEEWFFKIPSFSKSTRNSLVCSLRLAPSVKNIGIFPENVAHWPWMASRLASSRKKANVLNLFGYTGLNTLFMANLGAQVCHVDASKPSVEWAKRNQELSKLHNAQIRWIVDDCTKFMHREVKRGMVYDGIIMDPPAFGRDTKGNVFEFEKRIGDLLELCKKALSSRPLFFVFNGYSMGYSSTVLANLLYDYFPEQQIEHGELHLKEVNEQRTMPCSLFARF